VELEKLREKMLNVSSQLSEVQVQKDNMKIELDKCVASLGESCDSNMNIKKELVEATAKIVSQEQDLVMLKSKSEEMKIELQKGKEQLESETTKLMVRIVF